VLVRLPNEWPTTAVNDLIEKSLASLSKAFVPGTLIVIEPQRIRIRTFL